MPGTTTNQRLSAWVATWAAHLQPDQVHWCDGSEAEFEALTQELVQAGTFTPLDPEKRPGSFWAHSDPADVARVEDRTFICSADPADAGPTNNWRDPATMRTELMALYAGAIGQALQGGFEGGRHPPMVCREDRPCGGPVLASPGYVRVFVLVLAASPPRRSSWKDPAVRPSMVAVTVWHQPARLPVSRLAFQRPPP